VATDDGPAFNIRELSDDDAIYMVTRSRGYTRTLWIEGLSETSGVSALPFLKDLLTGEEGSGEILSSAAASLNVRAPREAADYVAPLLRHRSLAVQMTGLNLLMRRALEADLDIAYAWIERRIRNSSRSDSGGEFEPLHYMRLARENGTLPRLGAIFRGNRRRLEPWQTELLQRVWPWAVADEELPFDVPDLSAWERAASGNTVTVSEDAALQSLNESLAPSWFKAKRSKSL
jgi:hypothetical protein